MQRGHLMCRQVCDMRHVRCSLMCRQVDVHRGHHVWTGDLCSTRLSVYMFVLYGCVCLHVERGDLCFTGVSVSLPRLSDVVTRME